MQRHSRTLTPASPVHYYSALYSQVSGQDCDGAWGQAPIKSLLTLPKALRGATSTRKIRRARMLPVSQVRPEPRWPGIPSQSQTIGLCRLGEAKTRVRYGSCVEPVGLEAQRNGDPIGARVPCVGHGVMRLSSKRASAVKLTVGEPRPPGRTAPPRWG